MQVITALNLDTYQTINFLFLSHRLILLGTLKIYKSLVSNYTTSLWLSGKSKSISSKVQTENDFIKTYVLQDFF